MKRPTILLAGATALLLLGTSISAFAAGPDDAFEKGMDSFLSKDENVKKIGDSLERYFQKKREEAQQQAMRSEQDKMETQFKNPVKVDVGSSPLRGNPNAKVTIVAFSDFQCPFCQRGATVLEDVMKAYPNDVKIAFKNLPLPFHEKAKPAAKAALAAGKQGKFWEMHDLLFKNQQALGDDLFPKLASDLGLNVEKFKTDMNSPEVAKQIEDESELARTLGVNGTPGFFVNGVLISGAQPLPAFKAVIDRWLKG